MENNTLNILENMASQEVQKRKNHLNRLKAQEEIDKAALIRLRDIYYLEFNNREGKLENEIAEKLFELYQIKIKAYAELCQEIADNNKQGENRNEYLTEI